MFWYRALMLAISMSFIVTGYYVFKDYDITDPIYGLFCLIGFIIFAVGTIRTHEGE